MAEVKGQGSLWRRSEIRQSDEAQEVRKECPLRLAGQRAAELHVRSMCKNKQAESFDGRFPTSGWSTMPSHSHQA